MIAGSQPFDARRTFEWSRVYVLRTMYKVQCPLSELSLLVNVSATVSRITFDNFPLIYLSPK